MITTPQSRQYGINHHFRGHVLARRWRRSKDSSSSPAGWPNIRIELRKTLQIWHYEKKWWFHCTKTTIEPHDWTINKWGFMFWLLKKNIWFLIDSGWFISVWYILDFEWFSGIWKSAGFNQHQAATREQCSNTRTTGLGLCLILRNHEILEFWKKYFTSCDPQHDIYTFSYWQIFWHSIWHIFWYSIWHSIWHIFWHIYLANLSGKSIWHIYLAYLSDISIWHIYLAFYLAYLLAYILTYLLAFYLAFYLAYLLTFYLTYLLTFFLAYLLTFCLAYLLTFFLTFFLAFYLAYLLTFYLTSFLTFFPLRSGSAHCDLEVAVEVRQCPLRSGSRGWGPAVPTAIWKSRWRSGSAHWDLELAVEVRQCPLGSGARSGGPAVPTGIWTARRRRRVRRRRRRRWRRRRRRRRRRRTALIKSNNPQKTCCACQTATNSHNSIYDKCSAVHIQFSQNKGHQRTIKLPFTQKKKTTTIWPSPPVHLPFACLKAHFDMKLLGSPHLPWVNPCPRDGTASENEKPVGWWSVKHEDYDLTMKTMGFVIGLGTCHL